MFKLKLIVPVAVLALTLLACGGVPQVNMSVAMPTTPVPNNIAPAVVITPIAPPTLPPAPTPLPPELIEEADAEERLLINLYERVSPSVVSVQAVQSLETFEHPPLPEDVPTPEIPDQPFRSPSLNQKSIQASMKRNPWDHQD